MVAQATYVICPSCRERNIPGDDACWSCLASLSGMDLPETDQPEDAGESSNLNRSLATMRLRRPVTMDLGATVGEAVNVLRNEPGGAVVVLDGDQVCGIFTERDVLNKVAAVPGILEKPVTSVMTRDPVLLDESDRMNIVLHKMGVGGFRHLPVMREGELVGLVAARDVVRWVLLQYFD
jgi:CBS domain-containing protein